MGKRSLQQAVQVIQKYSLSYLFGQDAQKKSYLGKQSKDTHANMNPPPLPPSPFTFLCFVFLSSMYQHPYICLFSIHLVYCLVLVGSLPVECKPHREVTFFKLLFFPRLEEGVCSI